MLPSVVCVCVYIYIYIYIYINMRHSMGDIQEVSGVMVCIGREWICESRLGLESAEVSKF